MTPSELLERLAITFKTEVGPAVDGEYPRTQAFLSAVVLQKLAGQLRFADMHAAAEARERAALAQDLKHLLDAAEAPPSLDTAFTALSEPGNAGLCRFIEALYASREQLGEAHFDAVLSRVRKALRGSLDRRMEYAS
ncbi:MAG: hypothetical protein HQ511_09140 [Rhodospirillales bacterium]|nr:hypothetical protein [Rhodospirillales bacterium]